MAYDEYRAPYRPGGRYRFDREFERRYHLLYDRDYRGGGGNAPPERMGMHDFAERYGRYSGGPPDAYEYSERTILHGHRPHPGGIGFTRPLRRGPRARRAGYGAGFHRASGRRPGGRRPGPGPRPRRWRG